VLLLLLLLLPLPRCRQLGFHDRSGFACAKGSTPGTKTVTLLTQNMRAVLSKRGVMVKVQPGTH
jgi:hypothetical protein